MSDPTPSLIQQRMAITRDRTYGIVMTVLALLIAASGIARAVGEANDPLLAWLLAGVSLALAAISAVRALRATRRLRAFEAEHGAEAGKQRPIGR
ncbi:hypothetical protein [Labedella endophytica]|uniref:Uncharacterized protein n=1 Tax=Labedella endophytica TaxID=1523160 RepID=A0A433JW41_9MICO|nr:hypothetical protein [Labedella endophytica]RUR03087.1 hypothetical protein ELQ94_00570 [Labedella endophytica]